MVVITEKENAAEKKIQFVVATGTVGSLPPCNRWYFRRFLHLRQLSDLLILSQDIRRGVGIFPTQ